jgi:hypothetical protein
MENDNQYYQVLDDFLEQIKEKLGANGVMIFADIGEVTIAVSKINPFNLAGAILQAMKTSPALAAAFIEVINAEARRLGLEGPDGPDFSQFVGGKKDNGNGGETIH